MIIHDRIADLSLLIYCLCEQHEKQGNIIKDIRVNDSLDEIDIDILKVRKVRSINAQITISTDL